MEGPRSRPRWRTGILVVLLTGTVVGLVYAFRGNLVVQGIIFGILSVGVSATAWRAKTRRGELARLFMGPFVFSVFLYTVAGVGVASIPGVLFWLLTTYYGFLDVTSEDPLEVNDDRTESQ